MTVYSKDILYSQGEHPEEVFFIMRGRVKLCYDISEGEGVPRNIPFNMYVEGSYFGEMEMMIKMYQNYGRDGTAIVDCECHLLVIESLPFRKTLKHFPLIKEQMVVIAKKRQMHHLNAINDAKKRAIEKGLKGLKAGLFTGT